MRWCATRLPHDGDRQSVIETIDEVADLKAQVGEMRRDNAALRESVERLSNGGAANGSGSATAARLATRREAAASRAAVWRPALA